MPTLVFTPPPPYDFAKTIRRLQGVGHEMYRYDNGYAYRTIREGSGVVLLQMSADGDADRPCLHVRLYGDGLTEELVSAVRRRLTMMLSLNNDLRQFYDHVAGDPALVALSHRFYGLSMIREADPFECIVKTIIGQQMNLAFAARLNSRLIALASQPFRYEGREYPIFPTPEQIAALRVEELMELQFSRRKAEYVLGMAREVAEGRLNFTELERMEDMEIVERLIRLRGVGRWTAECFLLFGMGRRNVLPAADIGLRNAVRKAYGLGGQPTEEEVRTLGGAWSPWSSYAVFYLWESLNQRGTSGESAVLPVGKVGQ